MKKNKVNHIFKIVVNGEDITDRYEHIVSINLVENDLIIKYKPFKDSYCVITNVFNITKDKIEFSYKNVFSVFVDKIHKPTYDEIKDMFK